MRLGGNPRDEARRPANGPGDDMREMLDSIGLGGRSAGFVTFIAVIGLSLVILVLGFGNVEITEYGLNYSLLTRKVGKNAYISGRYFIGPFNYFVKFPSVVRTIQFSDAKMQADLPMGERSDGLLRSRTRDGLDVSIELSFQYQLDPTKLYELYTTLGGQPQYHNVFVRVATDRLTEVATMYTATEFFVDRTAIGKDMEDQLMKDFELRLSASIFSFQLRSVALPQEFEEAIQQTEVMKQDVQVAKAEQNATRVALETQLMQAKRRTKILSNNAEAIAASVMLSNKADITQYAATQEKSADSYSQILEKLDGKEEDLLAYMQARAVRDHASELLTVGLELPRPSPKE